MTRESLQIIVATLAPGKFPVADKVFSELCAEILRKELAKRS